VATNPYACGSSTPSNSFGKGTNAGATPIWDSFLHVLPYEAYHFYGDLKPATTAFPADAFALQPHPYGGQEGGAGRR
jgi:hypothetical protein